MRKAAERFPSLAAGVEKALEAVFELLHSRFTRLSLKGSEVQGTEALRPSPSTVWLAHKRQYKQRAGTTSTMTSIPFD